MATHRTCPIRTSATPNLRGRALLGRALLGAALFGAGLPRATAAAQAEQLELSDVPSPTRSQDASYFGLLLTLGVAGAADAELDVLGITGSVEDDLEASFGGAITFMHPLHRYFLLGGQLGALSWINETADAANQDRNLLVDVLLVPQGRFPVTDAIELTASLPLGLLVDFAGESASVAVGGMNVASADVPPALGFELGLLLGARFMLSSHVGLIAQLGYVAHFFEHELELQAGGTTAVSPSVDFSLGQPRLQVGVSF